MYLECGFYILTNLFGYFLFRDFPACGLFCDKSQNGFCVVLRCRALRAAPLYSRLGGPVRLLACTGQAAKPSGIRTWAPFFSASTELEPYSRLNRTTCGASQIVRFSTSRQGTPRTARESGIFSWFGVAGFARLVAIGVERSDFKVVFTPPRCLRPFSDTKIDCRIFPTKEPADFFFGPCGVKKFTPPDGGARWRNFLKKIVGTVWCGFKGMGRRTSRLPVLSENRDNQWLYRKGSNGNV